MDLHIYLHTDADSKIFEQLLIIKQKLETMGNTLDEVLTEVGDESTQIDSLAALMDGIEQQLKDALAGTTLPPAVQDKIDAVFAGVASNKQKVVDAINKGTTPPTP